MTDYYIDIGNTRIKHTSSKKPFSVNFATHEKTSPIFQSISQNKPRKIYLVSGRSAHAEKTKAEILEFSKNQELPLEIISVQKEILAINYADPMQFGTDRFLHLLAASARYAKPFCVISAGTAITLDFYTNRHIGGMILPGLGSVRALLAEKTGLTTIAKPDHLLGDDTASSIGAGIYIGYQNLITSSVDRVATNENTSFHQIWTGGDADIFHFDGEIISDLLFQGMKKYSEHTSTTSINPK